MTRRAWLTLLPAALPAAAGCVWVRFAHAWPEPWLERVRAGEACWSPTWIGCTEFVGEPLHLGMRLLHRLALAVPGATFASTAWLGAAFALATALLLAALLRATFALPTSGHRLALVLCGLLIATPGHGAVWLAGERVGMVVTPLLLLLALTCLRGDGRFRRRASAALLLAGLAPFCHGHGILVPFAVVPALRAAAVRAGSARVAAWVTAALLLGNVAAAISLRTAGELGAGAPGLAAVGVFLARLGTAGGDLLPGTAVDDLAIGVLTLLSLAVLPRLGDPAAARPRAAAWWSCVWFAIGLLLVDVLRFGTHPPTGMWSEATFGAFLLPIGLVGILACHLGAGVLRYAAGALLVLSVQSWLPGLEVLRLARARGERVDAMMSLPADRFGGEPRPLRHAPAELEHMRALGWVAAAVDAAADATVDAGPADDAPASGTVTTGDATSVRGFVRSTLRWPGIALVIAVDADQPDRWLGHGWPDFAAAAGCRSVPWTLRFAAPIAAGRRLAVLGYRPGPRSLVRLGGALVLRNGQLTAEAPR
ncbi:MAG: hypothetical protein MUC36_18450 [Planctomycetes bacterium]|jgi:hypothetical protein|nr:hypothetical protein [Planctomycetota bacterium]